MARESAERIAIITVHGTGDTAPDPDGEKWWQRGSEFSGWLHEEFSARGVDGDIHPLLWTGANSATAREEAARALMKQVRSLAKEYESVHVIGHSHGGNVASEAAAMLAWSGGRAKGKSARDRLRSITTVGTPFFKSAVTAGERLGAYGFGLMALASAALVAFLLINPGGFLGATTGEEWFTDAAAIEARNQALAAVLRTIGIAGLAALAFIVPIAWRGLLRIRQAGRHQPRAGQFSIWHAEDEAISFLQRLEALQIEPFAHGSLWRGSRTGGILWGVRAVFMLPILGLLALAAEWGLYEFFTKTIEFPPYGFGPAPLAAVGQQMILFGVAGAPLVFAVVYLFYRAFAYLGLELAGRGPLNTMIGGALKGIAFGQDGDHRIGQVSSRSHRFGTRALVLDGEVAARMTADSSDAARRLFDKYRSGAFGVDSDQGEIAREIAEDALTWDALIHTTYFDHREIAEAIANHVAKNLGAESEDEAALLPPATLFEGEGLLQGFTRLVLGWSLGGFRFAVLSAALLGAVASLAVFFEPIANNDHLADKQGAIATPLPYFAGQTLKECEECPEMIVLPDGTFSMGSPTDEQGRLSIEGPIQRVRVEPFAVGKFEVTFAEWDACVADGGCNGYSPYDGGWGRDARPVINVSWQDAQAYVAWLNGKFEGDGPYRVLTEAEWEYAARAGTTTAYPWGAEASRTFANYGTDSCCGGFASGADKWVYTAPVGEFPPNPFGLHDMHGNVYEWVKDCYRDNLSGQTAEEWPGDKLSSCLRVLRGGSWYYDPDYLRSAVRVRGNSTYRANIFGFRLARTL